MEAEKKTVFLVDSLAPHLGVVVKRTATNLKKKNIKIKVNFPEWTTGYFFRQNFGDLPYR